MASEDGNLNSKHLSHVETPSNSGNAVVQDNISNISSVSSPSSSGSDPLELNNGDKDAQDNALPPDVDDHTAEWSMISAYPRAGTRVSPYTPDWSVLNASPRVSPPVQTMGRSSDYDPNRIPSSIFATKSSGPMDWSVASNESLFSIHMGNNSFSKDYFIMFGKSGELSMLDELSCLPPTLHPVTEDKPSVIEAQSSNFVKSANRVEDNGAQEKTNEILNVLPEKNADDYSKAKIPTEGARPGQQVRPSVSLPRLSNESGNSSSSFVFPILAGDFGKNGSLKSITEQEKSQLQPQPQPPTPGATPKAAETRWFSCCSYIFCCHCFSRDCCYCHCHCCCC